MERFESICEAYINGSEEVKEAILSVLTEEEQEQFLVGCGLYRIHTDNEYRNVIQEVLCEEIRKVATEV